MLAIWMLGRAKLMMNDEHVAPPSAMFAAPQFSARLRSATPFGQRIAGRLPRAVVPTSLSVKSFHRMSTLRPFFLPCVILKLAAWLAMLMVCGPFSIRNDCNDQQGSETDTVLSVLPPVSVQREWNDETRVWSRRAVDRLPSKIVSRHRWCPAGWGWSLLSSTAPSSQDGVY